MNRTVHSFLLSVILVLLCVPASGKEPRARKHTGDTGRLQGTWLADLEPGLQGRLVLRKSRLLYVHTKDGRETVVWDGHFGVNDQAAPKQMDWTPLRRGRRNPPANLAIYDLQGDTLLVIGSTEGPRPTTFYSGGGSHSPKTVIFRRSSEDADGMSKDVIGANGFQP